MKDILARYQAAQRAAAGGSPAPAKGVVANGG
jgi:hypothetical protein